MTNSAKILIRIIKEYSSNKININNFIEIYQSTYEDIQDKLEEMEINILDKIYMACELYEQDKNIRTKDKNLINEVQLKNVISQNLEHLLSEW